MRKAVICLGRYGDIVNSLPIAFHEYQNGHQVTFVTSKEYADILEGVTYCESLTWPNDYSTPTQAAQWVERSGRFDEILVAQCYGTKHEIQCRNFCEEAWRLVGKHDLWGKLPLVFDRRNNVREKQLISSLNAHDIGDPIILVNHRGLSSPFSAGDELMSCFEPLKEYFTIIDLSTVRAQRFYDLLALYERAFCLVSIDTGTLHLAQAAPNLPVIAVVTESPTPWHGSPERPNHVLRIGYREFSRRKQEITALLENPIAFSQPRLIHVWNDYQGRSADANRRHSIAAASWEMEYEHGPWKSLPVFEDQLPRNGTSVGAHKPVPFVNDLLDKAAAEANDRDIIVLTNDDTIFIEGLTQRLLQNAPCWGPRYEKQRVGLPVDLKQAEQGSYLHCGSDVFAFTKSWWMQHREKFPPFLISFEAWDLALRTLIDLNEGKKVTGLCCHILHDPEWHSPKHRESRANLYNRASAVQFFSSHRMPWPKV